MVRNLCAVLFILLISSSYADTVQITESELIKLAHKEIPSQLQARSIALQAEAAEAGLEEQWSTQLVTTAKYQDSRERAIASSIPTFGPTTDISIGVSKNWLPGISTNVAVFSNQTSTLDTSVIDRATRTGVRAGLSIDLLKNFLGRQSRASLNQVKLKRERMQHQSYIQSRNVEYGLRKLYWSMVANEEARRLTQQQIKFSEKQMKAARRRYRSSVADRGELARYEAQLASRVSQLGSLDYQKRLLVEGLRQQIPAFLGKEIELAPYSVENAINDVVMCAASIQLQKEVPWVDTRYDELISLIEREYNAQQKVTSTHSGADLKLDASLQVSGMAQGYGNSLDDYFQNGRGAYSVGLTFSLPLDGKSSRAEDAQAELNKKLFLAEKDKLRAQVMAQHTETTRVVGLLNTVLANQKKNIAALERSLKESTRKYRQARISVQELIADQDQLLASQYSEIETKLSVIHRLLDYFGYFTESSCKINRVGVTL